MFMGVVPLSLSSPLRLFNDKVMLSISLHQSSDEGKMEFLIEFFSTQMQWEMLCSLDNVMF